MPIFSVAPKYPHAFRILPSSINNVRVLVANGYNIVGLDEIGNIRKTYGLGNYDCYIALTFDPDGQSFWAADYCGGFVRKFNIASGDTSTSFNTGAAAEALIGICLYGKINSNTILSIDVQPYFATRFPAGQGLTDSAEFFTGHFL